MKPKLRLLIQSKDYGENGGIARYLEGLLNNISNNLDITILTAKRSKEGTKISEKVKIVELPYHENRLNKILWAIRCKKLIKKLYNENKIDLVNIHIPPLLPGLFTNKDVPLVVTAHTTYMGETGKFSKDQLYKQTRSKLEQFIRFKLEKIIFNKANKIITLTEQGKFELLQYGVEKDKIAIFPNGVDENYFKSKKIKKDIDILFLGRLTPRKGSRSLVEICKLLVKKNAKIKIMIVGFGEDENYVKENLKDFIDKGNIIFTGRIPQNETIKAYQRSKVYCSTSYYEGLPSTCLEALSCGLPVIVWDLLFYKNLVKNNKNGFLVKLNDYEDMYKKIELTLKKNKLKARLPSNFIWKNIMKELELFFLNVIKIRK